MRILKWLRKHSETLSARGKEAERLSRSNSEQKVESVCQVSASIALLSDAHFSFLCPLSQAIKYHSTWPEPGKPISNMFPSFGLCMFINMASFSHPILKRPGMLCRVHISSFI